MRQIQTDLDERVFKSLNQWNLTAQPSLHLLNISENRTYLVKAPGFKAALRVHRTEYNSYLEIRSELDWLQVLRQSELIRTPQVIRGVDGRRIQILQGNLGQTTSHMVMFEFVNGLPPDESKDLCQLFEKLGEISARLHRHSMTWRPAANFTRCHWNIETILGSSPRWGNWRHAPFITTEARRLLEQLETVLIKRLQSYGTVPDRYGLIHADMRLANLMIGDDGETWVIDFDDCGYGWFIYDFAAGVSFMEDDEQIPELKAHWIKGYRRYRDLSTDDHHEIDTMVMLRRMALLAWIGSRIESTEPKKLAPTFAENTANLAENYLQRYSTS